MSVVALGTSIHKRKKGRNDNFVFSIINKNESYKRILFQVYR